MKIFTDENENENEKSGVVSFGTYVPWGRHKNAGGTRANYPRLSGTMLDFKEGNAAALSALAEHLQKQLRDDKFTICVVPSHDASKSNSSAPLGQLVKLLCKGTNRIDASPCLKRHTTVPKLARGGNRSKQVHLDSINVISKNNIFGRDVLILDDITTTGNSLEACCELLLAAGAKSVRCLAITKTE